MERRSMIPIAVPVVLYFFSGLTILISVARVVQIAIDAVPDDSLRLMATPASHLTHVVGGALFGIIGPLQFGRVLARRYGWWHRVLGRVFVVSGAVLSISSLTLLWHFPDTHPPLVNYGRLVFGIGLGIALIQAMRTIYARDIPAHRNWMIRAYAIGMGATLVSVAFVPIYVATGVPPMGLFADVLFIGLWAACVVFAEMLIRRINKRKSS